MVDTNISNTTTTSMDTEVPDYQVDPQTTDAAGDQKETRWTNTEWTEQLGIYHDASEFRSALIILGVWVAGKGYESKQKVILENITGWGEDTFTSVMKNLIRTKRIGGDAYAEIIRNDEGTLINLKPLSPERITIIVNAEGIITGYEQISKIKGKKPLPFTPQQILHLCNNRVADEIHGDSDAKSVKWLLEAKKEAMSDWRRISHRSTIRVLYIDAEDTTRLGVVKEQYKDAIKNGEVMIIPAKRGEAEMADYNLPPVEAYLRWIEYLDNKFYQDIRVPRVLVTSEGFTESGGKVGFLTFEPIYTDEQVELEADLWNQCAIKVKFNRPPSLGGDLQRDEAKDTGQMGIQPKDTEVTGEGRE